MNGVWSNFNDADTQSNFDVIPKGTLAKVRLTFRPGGYDDPPRGLTGGLATQNPTTGSIYMSCEYVITEGQYAKRKIWSLIGLLSRKGPEWGNMGRSFIRGILNSAHGVSDKDTSPRAIQARCINSFHDLDGIEFLAKIDMEKDQYDQDKNVIKFAITPDHKEYKTYMGTAVPPTQGAYNPQPQTPQGAYSPQPQGAYNPQPHEAYGPQSPPPPVQVAPPPVQAPSTPVASPPVQAPPTPVASPPVQAAPSPVVPLPVQAAPSPVVPPPVQAPSPQPVPQQGFKQPAWAQ